MDIPYLEEHCDDWDEQRDLSWYLLENTLYFTGDGTLYGWDKDDDAGYALQETVETIIIDEGCTAISDRAFEGFEKLTALIIPDSVEKIGWWICSGNCGLPVLRIPAGVTDLGWALGRLSPSLYAVEVDENNSRYASRDGILYDKEIHTLIYCPEGKKGDIRIPEGVTKIVREAFYNCGEITAVTIPDSVTELEEYAFFGCKKLEEIHGGRGVRKIGRSAFSGNAALRQPFLPESLEEFTGSSVFSNCAGLRSITIPLQLGMEAVESFYYSRGITRILAAPGHPLFVSVDGVLFSKDRKTLLLYPEGRAGSYRIPDTVTKIRKKAFLCSDKLTEIVIPDSVREIEESAFCECSSLLHAVIPDSVMKIGACAFMSCRNLLSVRLPESLREISRELFRDCGSLAGLEIPAAVEEMKGGALLGCSNLLGIGVPESVQRVCHNTFWFEPTVRSNPLMPKRDPSGFGGVLAENADLLKNEAVQSGRCGENLRWYLQASDASRLPKTWESRENLLYIEGMGGLPSGWETASLKETVEKVVIAHGCTALGAGAFRGFVNLKTVLLPVSLKSIGEKAFADCPSLAVLYVPSGVMQIGQTAFEGISRIVYYGSEHAGDNWGAEKRLG